MATEIEFNNLLEQARSAVHAHPKFELILPLRRKIWRQLGEHQSNFGFRKRFQLAAACVNKVLPIWDTAFPDNNTVKRLIQLSEEYVEKSGIALRDEINLIKDKFLMFLDHNMMHKEQPAISVAQACAYTVRMMLNGDVAKHELTDSTELDDDLDLFRWDSSYFASAAYAGEFPFELLGETSADCDITKIKEFWLWYLDEVEKLA